MYCYVLRCVVVCFFIQVLYVLYVFNSGAIETRTYLCLDPDLKTSSWEIRKEFLVNSETCLIREMDPFDPSLVEFVKIQKVYGQCSTRPDLTYKSGFTIFVNTSAFTYFKNFSHCIFTAFVKSRNSGSGVSCLKTCRFKTSISAFGEFGRVICYNTSKSVIQKNIYAFIKRNETVDNIMERRYTKLAIGHGNKPLNVLLFGFESTSRLNFVRHMNETRSFILDTLGGVEMLGYNKVGQNTYPNKIATFLGITEAEMYHDAKQFFDKYPFIWKNFSNAGYRTFFIEDGTFNGAFHYCKAGFMRAPVDHYLFPFMEEVERTERKGYCSGKMTLAQHILDSAYDYVQTYNDVPHYMDVFISGATHDNVNRLGILDYPYLNLLTSLHTKGYLNNTVMLFFGDHGMRYGPMRSTFLGRLEEHLPVLTLVLPDWLKTSQPDLLRNLHSNARKLTCNFDIYATLLDIIYIGQGYTYPPAMGKYGTSLLRQIRSNRTCSELKIPESFCSCSMYHVFTDLTDKLFVGAVEWTLTKLNQILSNVTDLCEHLELDKVLRASRSSDRVRTSKNRHYTNYNFNFMVKPGGGMFEGAVRYEDETRTYTSLGTSHVQRINMYGNQSHCVSTLPNGRALESVCYCKNQSTHV